METRFDKTHHHGRDFSAQPVSRPDVIRNRALGNIEGDFDFAKTLLE